MIGKYVEWRMQIYVRFVPSKYYAIVDWSMCDVKVSGCTIL